MAGSKKTTARSSKSTRKTRKTTSRKSGSRKSSGSGSMNANMTATLSGGFDGRIVSKGDLHISRGTRCKADVNAKGMRIEGSFQGDVKVQNECRVNSGATCKGTVSAKGFHVQEGGNFDGHCKVGSFSRAA